MRRSRRSSTTVPGFTSTEPLDLEAILAEQMIAAARLAAHYVAAAEQAGTEPSAIRQVLRDVTRNSGIDEFWITDSDGHAYLTSTDIEDFRFSPNAARQPQAAVFWSLLEGSTTVVVQEARQREIDCAIFKYVGVAGVDKPRIVQVGIHAGRLRS